MRRLDLVSAPLMCPVGSDSKYGRTVHLATKDNPRLINIPPRDSDEWKTADTALVRCGTAASITS